MSEENPWYIEQLPEGLRDPEAVPFLKDTKSPEEFVNHLKNASQYMGNSLRIPGPDAGEDDWNGFYDKMKEKVPNLIKGDLESPEGRTELLKRLGVPEKPDEYGADAENSWLAEAAHKANLTKDQFENLMKDVADRTTARQEESEHKRQEALDELFSEWGYAKTRYMENIEGLLKTTEAPEGLAQQVLENPTADTLRWLHSMAQQFDTGDQGPGSRTNTNNLSVDEAKAQIQELLNNPDYFTGGERSRMLQKRMIELQRVASTAR